MYAIVENGAIKRVWRGNQPMEINGIKHPKTIFSGSWTEAERNAIGIYKVSVGPQGNSKFNIISGPAYTFSNNKVVGTYTASPKALEDITQIDTETSVTSVDHEGYVIISEGLKSQYISNIKKVAASLLEEHDWRFTRSYEDNTRPVVVDIKDYRAAVRTASDTIEAAITLCVSVGDLEALEVTPTDSDGVPTGPSPLQDWPNRRDHNLPKRK